MRPSLSRAIALGLGLGSLSACSLEVDPSLSKPDPKDSSTVEPRDDAEVGWPEEDAEVDAAPPPDAAMDSGPRRPDGSIEPRYEGGMLVDARTGDAQAASCKQDSECSAEQFCSVGGQCLARCDTARGCVGPRIENFASMISIDDELLWATGATSDSLGNRRSDGALWRWDRKGDPTQVARNLNLSLTGILAFALDGYAYFHLQSMDGTQPLRIAFGATSSPPGTWNDATVWFTENYIWWAPRITNDGGTAKLYRLARRADATPELVRELGTPGFLTGGESFVVITDGYGGPIYREAIDGSDRVQLSDFGGSPTLYSCQVQGANLLCLDSIAHFISFETTAFSRFRVLGKFVNSPDPRQLSFVQRYRLLGDWAYWSASTLTGDERQFAQFGRSRVDLARDVEVLKTFERPYRSSSHVDFVVSRDGSQIIYFASNEKRLFTLDVAPLPCAADLPCPGGLSCQSDQTCR